MKTPEKDLLVEEIVQTLLGLAFDYESVDSHVETVEIIMAKDTLRCFRSEEFLNQFRDLILDQNQTWSQKAEYIFPIFDDLISEDEYQVKFRYMWDTVMDSTQINEPWPLDNK